MENLSTISESDVFLCPLTRKIMTDPVVCEDGHTYERSSITAWIKQGNSISPVSERKLTGNNIFYPNIALKKIIDTCLVKSSDIPLTMLKREENNNKLEKIIQSKQTSQLEIGSSLCSEKSAESFQFEPQNINNSWTVTEILREIRKIKEKIDFTDNSTKYHIKNFEEISHKVLISNEKILAEYNNKSTNQQQKNYTTVSSQNINFFQHMLTLKNHTSGVLSVAFSRDGNFLATGSYDFYIYIHRIKNSSMTLIKSFKQSSYIYSVTFSRDNSFLATGSNDSSIKIYKILNENISELQELKDHTKCVNSLAFSGDSIFLASGADDYKMNLYRKDKNLFSLVKAFSNHSDLIYSVAFSSNGNFLVSGSRDMKVNVYRKYKDCYFFVRSLKESPSIVYSVAFSSDDLLLAAGSDKTVTIYKVEDDIFHLYRELKDHSNRVNYVAFSRENSHLITGSFDHTVNLYLRNKDDFMFFQTLKDHTHNVRAVAISEDSKLLASASEDYSTNVYRRD